MAIDSYGKELGRKVIHIFALAYLAIYFGLGYYAGPRMGLLALVLILILEIIIEYLRLERGARLPFLSWVWDNYRREKEQKRVGAEIFFLLGVIVALAVFETRVAVAAVLMTVFGDMTAALVGRRFGRIRPGFCGGKSLEGAAAALIVNLAVGWLILRAPVPGGVVWWLAWLNGAGQPAALGAPLWGAIVSMSLTGALTELIISEIDDNLTIPVFAGFAGQLVLLLF
jgi:phytol kinase